LCPSALLEAAVLADLVALLEAGGLADLVALLEAAGQKGLDLCQ
jgi:hypothetical protein